MAAEGASRNRLPGGVTAAGPSRIRTVFRYRRRQKQFFSSSTSIPSSSQQPPCDKNLAARPVERLSDLYYVHLDAIKNLNPLLKFWRRGFRLWANA
jgi:hypothetical protein